MTLNSTFAFDVYNAELDYRADRIRRGVGRNRRRLQPQSRRSEETTAASRR